MKLFFRTRPKGRMVIGEMNPELEPSESLLHAQVRVGEPEMRIDSEGRLRHANFPGAEGSLFLGDVVDALLRGFGAHEPPRVIEAPGFDQQRWKIVVADPEFSVTIVSQSYWGFGLFASCFLNEIRMEGPLGRRARLAFDLAAALGRNPWEAKWRGRFAKVTGVTPADEKDAWTELIERGHQDLSDTIDAMRSVTRALENDLERLAEEAPEGWDFESAREEIGGARAEFDIAEDALHDRSATGVERALARAEAYLIEADPRTEVAAQFDSGEELLEAMAAVEAEEIDLSETVLTLEELPEDSIRTHTTIDAKDIPFVDLASEEE